MVTDCQPNHQLEPRGQYPMSGSSVVLAILEKWFPDLVAPYLQANSARDGNTNSVHIVKHYGFLRISQFGDIELHRLCRMAFPWSRALSAGDPPCKPG